MSTTSFDLDDETLAELDIVIVSVHSRFNMSKAEMTRRIVRALQHPRLRILGCEAKDVANTSHLTAFQKLLEK